MSAVTPTKDLIAYIEESIKRERKLGWLKTKRGRINTIKSVELMLADKANPARLSRQVLFGRVDDVQTFLGYLVYWAPGLVVFEPAPEFTDYFGLVQVKKSSDTKLEVHIDSLFDTPPRNNCRKIRIDFTYDETGTFADIIKIDGNQYLGGYRMFQQHAYTMLNWLAVMLGLKL